MNQKALDALILASDLGAAGQPMLKVALALVAGGWPVFPCGQDKAPLVGNGFKARTPSSAQVRQWWKTHPDAMPGICPGDCNFAALDVDSTKAAEAVDDAGFWPGSFVVLTGGTSAPFNYRGAAHKPQHIYIESDEAPSIEGVVVRFKAGYVIAPGARRGDRMYQVCSTSQPPKWTKGTVIVSPTKAKPADLAPDIERVREVVAALPNPSSVDRGEYISVAHMIHGATGGAGKDIFLEWAGRWDGKVDAKEDERVFDTISAPKAGWDSLWRYAGQHGVDVAQETNASAQDDFPAVPVAAVHEKNMLQKQQQAESPKSKLLKLLQAVKDAQDSAERALAMRQLRKAGFTYPEVKSMMGELLPEDSDEGVTLEELLKTPELLKVPTPAIPYLCWPGNKTILAAREKTGKSTLVLSGVAAVTRGETFLGEQTETQKVLWLTEEPLATLAQRAVAMKVNPQNLIVVQMGQDPKQQLKKSLQRYSPQVVIIDTLYRFAGVEDENDASGWYPTLLQFDEVTQTGAALLIIAHMQRHGEEYRGSSAIGGHVDAILEMRKPKDGDRVRRIAGKGRLHFGKPFCVVLRDDNATFDLMGDADASAARAVEIAIQEVLDDGPAKATAVAEKIGKPADRVRSALMRMEAEGKIKRDGYKWALVEASDDFQTEE